MSDTLAELQAQQLQQLEELKLLRREQAREVLAHYAQVHDWPEGDEEEVRGALGLDRDGLEGV